MVHYFLQLSISAAIATFASAMNFRASSLRAAFASTATKCGKATGTSITAIRATSSAANPIRIEQPNGESAILSWNPTTSTAGRRSAYIVQYGLSRRATFQPRIEIKNLTLGKQYKLSVKTDNVEIANGNLAMCAPTDTDTAAGTDTAVELPLTELSRLEVRVGVIREICAHPDADTLYVEQVDVGEESGPRTIVSGLVKYIPEDELVGKRVVVLCNLKPRAMRGVTSHGMLLCASNEDHTQVDPLSPPEDAEIGTLIQFEGHKANAHVAPGNRASKAFDRVADQLRCGEDGIARFDNTPFMTEQGPCVSLKKLVGPVS